MIDLSGARGAQAVSDVSSQVALKRSYRGVLDRLDPYLLLDYYGAENVTDVGDELRHSCIIENVIPHHKNGDANPSASLNAESLLYICPSWGVGSLWWLLSTMESDNVAGIRKALSACLYGDEEQETKEDFSNKIKDILNKSEADNSYPIYHPKVLEPFKVIHPYMTESRGLSEDTLIEFQVGYDKRARRHVIPHFWDGNLVGWQTRVQDDPRWPMSNPPYPKYSSSPKMPKRTTLFGTHVMTDKDSVIVVESPMSVLKAHTLGWRNVLATFGAQLTDEQIRLLRDYPVVTLWPDNDPDSKAGYRGAMRTLERLCQYTQVGVVFPPDTRDLADLTLEEATQQRDSSVLGFLAKTRLHKELS